MFSWFLVSDTTYSLPYPTPFSPSIPLHLQTKYSELPVPPKFIVPSKSTEWPEQCWGIRLGEFVKGFKNGDCDTTEAQRLALSGLGFKAFAPSVMRKTAAAAAIASATAERRAGEVDGASAEIGMRETVGSRSTEIVTAETNEKDKEMEKEREIEREKEREIEREREKERENERERERDRVCNKSALPCSPELVT